MNYLLTSSHTKLFSTEMHINDDSFVVQSATLTLKVSVLTRGNKILYEATQLHHHLH